MLVSLTTTGSFDINFSMPGQPVSGLINGKVLQDQKCNLLVRFGNAILFSLPGCQALDSQTTPLQAAHAQQPAR